MDMSDFDSLAANEMKISLAMSQDNEF